MKMKRPEPSKPIDSTVMRRLDALERLINDEYSGKPKAFEEKTGVKMAQVGQWLTIEEHRHKTRADLIVCAKLRALDRRQ